MRRITADRMAIGALIFFAFWLFVFLPIYEGPRYPANKCSAKEEKDYGFWEKTQCDPVAYFTVWLVGFTGVLALSTIGLWWVSWRGISIQARDTRILQRAYLQVLPRGIDVTRERMVLGQIAIHNAGNLPARKVSNDAKIVWSEDRDLSTFEDATFPQQSAVLPARSEMLRGTGALEGGRTVLAARQGFIFVWGKVTYEDGFGEPRWLTFCHRYNCASPNKPGSEPIIGGGIAAEYARSHHFYNDGD
jgi:hypothetical protein